jgi:4-nitrophenyl phosphatase
MPNQFNLKRIEALAIDMDGVLWRGDTPLPGLSEFFAFLHDRSISFVLATNNASKTPAQYQQKLAGFGVTIEPEQVMTSSLATAAYLKRELKGEESVYVVGGAGIHEAVRQAGFTVVDDAGRPVEAVVVGIDFNLTYEKLKYAVLLIQRGARFIGTNGDLTFPAEEGYYPGAGAILAAIQVATKVQPVIIGKPEPLIFELAMQTMDSLPEHTAILGDRLETDILGGQRAGLKTILVTTGVDNEASITKKGVWPDVILKGIDELVDVWSREMGA